MTTDRESLCLNYRGLAIAMARKLYRRAMYRRLGDYDDVEQECFVALLEAIDSYDPGQGCKFGTWATRKVQWRLYRAAANAGLIRVSEAAQKAKKWDDPDVIRAYRPKSLSRKTMLEALPDGRVAALEDVDLVEGLLSRLDARDRRVLELRHGLAGDGDEVGWQEVGRVMGLSGRAAAQREYRALDQLRRLAGVGGGERVG